jgi:hypothetical protein
MPFVSEAAEGPKQAVSREAPKRPPLTDAGGLFPDGAGGWGVAVDGTRFAVGYVASPPCRHGLAFISLPRQERHEIRHGFKQRIFVDLYSPAASPRDFN